jgi:DNA-binding response OmpR family regulator
MKAVVIEDIKTVADLMKIHLEHQGFEAHTAQCGLDGIRLVKEHRPDVILLDLGLPDIDGRQVCADLKRNADTAKIPIVVVTAKSGDVERILTRVTGADAFLSKPFHLQELTEKIKEVMSAARAA